MTNNTVQRQQLAVKVCRFDVFSCSKNSLYVLKSNIHYNHHVRYKPCGLLVSCHFSSGPSKFLFPLVLYAEVCFGILLFSILLTCCF
jgi:hypothetical protein